MASLELYGKYSRKEVHDYFVPNGSFTPNAGTWGLHGCVLIPETHHDYVFFVTYGQTQGTHVFQEGISDSGIITWQSQPRQHLEEKRVIKWIQQKDRGDRIHLFVRSKKGNPYTYFGDIEYKSHNLFKEYPVWFEFELTSWQPTDSLIAEFVRNPTAQLGGSGVPATGANQFLTKPGKKQLNLELNSFDEHVRDLLTTNPHLIDAGEGYRWEANYEFDLSDVADLVFFGPGREVKVISICTAETEVSYLKAIKAKLWRSQLCFERDEDESSEFIQAYLIAKTVNENTKQFCDKYDVKLLIV